MAINKLENRSCSIQLLRSYNATPVSYLSYSKESHFLDASIKMTSQHSIPVILVDFSIEVRDYMIVQSVMISDNVILRL